MIIAFETQQAYRDYVCKVAGRAMYSKTPQTNTGFHALGIPEPEICSSFDLSVTVENYPSLGFFACLLLLATNASTKHRKEVQGKEYWEGLA